MPRNYKRKTTHGQTPPDVMERAVREVLVTGRQVRTVATEFEIPHVTLRRYILKVRGNNAPEDKIHVHVAGVNNQDNILQIMWQQPPTRMTSLLMTSLLMTYM